MHHDSLCRTTLGSAPSANDKVETGSIVYIIAYLWETSRARPSTNTNNCSSGSFIAENTTLPPPTEKYIAMPRSGSWYAMHKI